MKKIKAVIFDFGGVLLKWNPHKMLSPFFSDRGSIDNFLEEIDFMNWNALQDKGRSFEDGIGQLTEQFPQYAHIAPAFRQRWEESIDGPIAGSVRLLKSLKTRRVPVYGLSNWSAETFPIVRSRYHFFGLFDGIMLSGEVGRIKPDPVIFHLCLEMVGKAAEECLFIDDSAANIAAANLIGFDTVKFESAEQLEAELYRRELL